MSFVRTVICAFAATLVTTVSAQAAPKLMDSISAKGIVAMFDAHGIPAKAHADKVGEPVIDVDIAVNHGKGHVPTQVLMHDCHGQADAMKCRIIVYLTYWGTVRPVPLTKINAYNSEYYLGKVSQRSRHAKGPKKWALVVTSQVSLAGGVTENHIGASMYEWVRSVEKVNEVLQPKNYQK